MTQAAELTDITARVWGEVGGPADLLDFVTTAGPRTVLPSRFDVTGLATASVAAATLAAAEFLAARNGPHNLPVTVDSRQACAAFAAEGLFTPVGWDLPDIWDPIAGNYQAQDGWIRLHTNYAYHRAAVERLLGARDRESVRAAVARWESEDLETAVVQAGGCAAVMHTRADWLASPAGAATADAPLAPVAERRLPSGTVGVGLAADAGGSGGPQPYSGVRVLDLTRVIAGPVGTRFLAAYGAEVLRLDPPGFAEVPALLPQTTAGKRTAALDLTTADGRAAFEGLVATADVLVTGLRADALARLGYDDGALAVLNPALIVASLDAYGWDGPWRDRRGFDSLVQMSAGIAAAGAAATGADKPVPLPVQALDHGCGYLIAAAVGRSLTRLLTESVVSRIRVSLIGTANPLWSLPRPGEADGQPPMPKPGDFRLRDTHTAWGPARGVPLPGEITGVNPEWRVEAGPLGRHQPTWTPRAAGAVGRVCSVPDITLRPEPFAPQASAEALEDLRARLRATRWPDAPEDAGWSLGTDLAYLRELVAYWADGFDWPAQEAALARLPRFRVRLGGLGIHFVHARVVAPAGPVLPLVLSHGWPDSFWRYSKVIPLLTDPGAHGADPADAFDVVVPDMPGYGYSDRPVGAPLDSIAVAGLWAELMSVLSYRRFGAAGGDIGSGVSRYLALDHPDRVVAVHRTDAGVPIFTGDPADLTPEERAWSDCNGDIERSFSKDEILTNITIYWLTGTIGSSMRMYHANAAIPPAQHARRVEVPSGFSLFPADISHPPRAWLERSTNVVRVTEPARGGHFAPFEEPELYAEELRAFFRPYRRATTG